jgi:hypothetical protein
MCKYPPKVIFYIKNKTKEIPALISYPAHMAFVTTKKALEFIFVRKQVVSLIQINPKARLIDYLLTVMSQ